ncbi:MAG: isocitrate lyase/PEP mutase family protein, partial [Rhodospirillaceae bacterium]|nr:isocitrate lyase/PEP mutase family protein [Rhodospirillaceae bacterium]
MSTPLRARLASGKILPMPGIFDALSAHIAARAGFEGVFLSGSALAYTQLARPDFGLTTITEVADTLARIRDRVEIPVLVDADSGFGNALNVARTVKVLEHAGAAAIQIEDQINHKRPGDLQARPLVSVSEMVGKIKAALDARASESTLISARSDAPFTETFDQALARAQAYAEAGADIIFVEGLSELAHLQRLTAAFRGQKPLLHNVIDGGKSPVTTAAELQALGYAIVLFPGAAVQSAATAMEKALT